MLEMAVCTVVERGKVGRELKDVAVMRNTRWPVSVCRFLSLFSVIAGASAYAETPQSRQSVGNLVTVKKLNWRIAESLAGEAVNACERQGYSVTASVVDPSGHQQAVIKGDTVPLQSLSVSYRKAYTAFSYGMAFNKNSTSELIAAKVTGPLDGAVLATEPEIIFIAGGVTLRTADGTVIGGIGVSGAPGGDKDEACARAAVDKLQTSFR